MRFHRLQEVLFAALLAGSCVSAPAQTFPSKPLRWVVPFAAGGNSDIIARTMAREMEQTLGQNVLIDNRAGGGGSVGAGFVAKSAPDGYTLLGNGAGALVILPVVQKDLPYDPWKELAPVGLIFDAPFYVSARAASGWSSIQDVVAAARASPGKITIGHPAIGGTVHLAIELLKQAAGIDVQAVAYKGEQPAMVDFLGGRLDLSTGNLGVVGPHVKTGAVRILFQFGATRAPFLPDVPTARESGFPSAVVSAWFGMNVPAGTPEEAVAKINAAMVASLRTASAREQLEMFGQTPIGSTPQAYAEFLRAERDRWTPIVRRLDLKF